jgi:uncharacterized protein YuzE
MVPALRSGVERPLTLSVSRLNSNVMKLNYYADTDSLYIDLAERTSVESREISEGIVLDYDAEGNLVSSIMQAKRSPEEPSINSQRLYRPTLLN